MPLRLPPVPRGPGGGAAPRRHRPGRVPGRAGPGSAGQGGQEEQQQQQQRHGFRPLVVRHGECGGKPRWGAGTTPVGIREPRGMGRAGCSRCSRCSPAFGMEKGTRKGVVVRMEARQSLKKKNIRKWFGSARCARASHPLSESDTENWGFWGC